jgi:hypothetical protein
MSGRSYGVRLALNFFFFTLMRKLKRKTTVPSIYLLICAEQR